jgi:hypothetical protein
MATIGKNPYWWTDSQTSAWERTKEALRRDWEQTKADFTDGGRELNQDVGDTIKQAAGKQPIPPRTVPNTESESDTWTRDEPALRYGFGARHFYHDSEWNNEVESRMSRDWEAMGQGSTWDQVKNAVRRGWESAKH